MEIKSRIAPPRPDEEIHRLAREMAVDQTKVLSPAGMDDAAGYWLDRYAGRLAPKALPEAHTATERPRKGRKQSQTNGESEATPGGHG